MWHFEIIHSVSDVYIYSEHEQEAQCLEKLRAHLRARLEEVKAEISGIEAAEGLQVDIGRESHSSKRRRA